MTDPNKTSINVILDKSGSMEIVRMDTIGGYNTFIEAQKSLHGECEVSLIQFNHGVEVTYKSVNVKNLSKGLLPEQYNPNGGTALLDAIGNTIIRKGAELSALPESSRPGKVMFVIITDGQENTSRKFTFSQIKEMIEHQTSVYSWDFTFLGANIDTFNVASNLGISSNKSLSFSTSKPDGAMRMFAAVTNYAMHARCNDSMAATSYTEKDRLQNS
jgi:hypothetical protein